MRRRRIFLLIFAVALVAVVFHGVLLRGVGSWLVVDDDSSSSFDDDLDVALMVVSGDQAPKVAGRLRLSDESLRCLLYSGRPYRTEQLGVTPSGSAIGEQELIKEGFGDDQITILDGGAGLSRWDHVQQWMNDHPKTALVLLCDEFSSRGVRFQAGRWLSRSVLARIRFHPIPDRRYSEADWWKNRLGIRHVSACYLSLVFAALNSDRPESLYRNPDEYEEWFLASEGLSE